MADNNNSNNYKTDIDTSRTERFSPLYVIVSKIGLSCITYFFVGLTISLVYVLSDMDYFTLNGQFRTQRFFTDDGYYYSRQVVLLYGIFGLIITMFVGPIGKIPTVVWSWILTFVYTIACIYLSFLDFRQNEKYVLKFLGFVSFISHSLLCNFIFYFFYPKIYITIYDDSENVINDNSKNGYIFYQIISFICGYFLGLPSISYFLFKLTFTRKKIFLESVFIMKNVFLILILISLCNSLLLTYKFLYEYVNYTHIYKNTEYDTVYNNYLKDDDKIKSINIGWIKWLPFSIIPKMMFKTIIVRCIDIKLLFMWILNPLIVSIIPYTIGTHFYFHKFILTNTSVFSLLFIIVMLFYNNQLVDSCLLFIKKLNISILNILYTHWYFQLNDSNMIPTPISNSPYPNYIYQCFYTNSKSDNISDTSKHTTIKIPNFAEIPKLNLCTQLFSAVKSLENDDKILLYISYSMLSGLNEVENNNKYINEFGTYNVIEHGYNLQNCSSKSIYDFLNTSSHYLWSQYQNRFGVMISNLVDIYSDHIKNVPEYIESFGCCITVYLGRILDKNGSCKCVQSDKGVKCSSSSPCTSCTSCTEVRNLLKIFLKCSTNSIIKRLKEIYYNFIKNGSNFIIEDKNDQSSSQNKSYQMILKLSENFLLTLVSHLILSQCQLIIYRSFEYSTMLGLTARQMRFRKFCCCVCDFDKQNNGNKNNNSNKDYKATTHSNLNIYSKMYIDKMKENNGNSLCLCLIVSNKLSSNLLFCHYYLNNILPDYNDTQLRKFNKNTYSSTLNTDISNSILLVIYSFLKIAYMIGPRYSCICKKVICCCHKKTNGCNSKCTPCSNKKDGCCKSCENPCKKGCSCVCLDKTKNGNNNGKCCQCCCVCLCKLPDDEYYTYFIMIINYIVYVIENIFSLDNSRINYSIYCLSRLLSEFDIIDYNALKFKIILDDSKCLCKPKTQGKCTCECSKKKGTSCCCTNPNANCCCCIICKNCKIICYAICLGCCICCLCSVKECECHKKLKTCCDGLTTDCGTGKCQCQQICEKIKEIQKCTCNEGSECCKKLFESIDTNSSTGGATCSCENIFDKIKSVPQQCTENLKKVCESITTKFKENCSKEKKCSKLVLKSIHLLYEMSKLISWYYHNESKIQCLLCCCENGKCDQKNLKKKCTEYLETVNTNNKNISHVTHNSRINYSSNKIEMENIKIKSFNNLGNNYLSIDNLNHEYYKFKSIKIIILFIIIFVLVALRNNFDKYIYNDIIETKFIKRDERVDIKSSIFNIEHIKNENINREYEINKPKSNNFIYILISIVSLLSAFYSNMTIRNIYNRLNLEYNMWSYLINMVLMFGLILTLLFKYYIHVFDFVGVLDKYGMNLSKSDSFIDYVDRSDSKLIDHFSSPVKNMMTFGLFKSMTKDLRSLTMFKDVSKISGSTTTYSKLRHKLYPYKDMSKPVRRITKHCDKCQHSLCNIQKSVIKSLGTKESIDIVGVLDFLSYSMIYNNILFVSQYESYFSGDELYIIWRLNKHMNNNVFISEYYRHQTLTKIEQQIKQLINHDHKLGTSNLMLLWEMFGENEIKNITLKSMSDINEQQMIKDQREVLASILYNEYLTDFIRFEQYVCTTMFNSKLVSRPESLTIKSIVEFTNILNKHMLDKTKVHELINKYSRDSHDRKIKSLTLPTVSCNITGANEQITKNVKSYCDDWLKHKLEYCKHMNNLECEQAANVAYNTVIDLANKPGDLYQQIYDLLTKIDLTKMDNIFDISSDYTPKTLEPVCKDCESMSTFYINQYLSSTYFNIDKMLTPLGMYLSWHGNPIDKHHLNKCSHTQ